MILGPGSRTSKPRSSRRSQYSKALPNDLPRDWALMIAIARAALVRASAGHDEDWASIRPARTGESPQVAAAVISLDLPSLKRSSHTNATADRKAGSGSTGLLRTGRPRGPGKS